MPVHTKHAYPTMTTSSTHKLDTSLNMCVHPCRPSSLLYTCHTLSIKHLSCLQCLWKAYRRCIYMAGYKGIHIRCLWDASPTHSDPWHSDCLYTYISYAEVSAHLWNLIWCIFIWNKGIQTITVSTIWVSRACVPYRHLSCLNALGNNSSITNKHPSSINAHLQ